MSNFLTVDGLGYFKTKQDAANATKYAPLSSVKTKVSELTNDSGYQTASDVNSIVNQKVTNVYRYKGSVTSKDKLPSSGNTTGDVYDVGDGMNYAWNGTKWDALGDAKLTVDTALDASSTNPVQNKVVKAALDGKAASNHPHAEATTSAAGFMSTAQVSKLAGIANNANNYSLPTASASVKGGVKVGTGLAIDSNGVLSATAQEPAAISNEMIDELFANA